MHEYVPRRGLQAFVQGVIQALVLAGQNQEWLGLGYFVTFHHFQRAIGGASVFYDVFNIGIGLSPYAFHSIANKIAVVPNDCHYRNFRKISKVISYRGSQDSCRAPARPSWCVDSRPPPPPACSRWAQIGRAHV